MTIGQDEPPSSETFATGPVLAAVLTAVVGWACFRWGTQGRLPTELALAIALSIGALVGIVGALAYAGWLRRSRRAPEPEPVEPQPVEPAEDPEPRDTDVVEVIRTIAAEQQPRFSEAGTVLQAMASGCVRVDATRSELTGELAGLLDESFEATRRLDRGEVLIGLARKTVAGAQVARITVTDNRVGATSVLTLPMCPSEQAELVGSGTAAGTGATRPTKENHGE